MKQITIVTGIRTGLVADISSCLAERGINIESLDAEEVKNSSVVTLTVSQYDEALRALRDAGFDAVTEDAIVIKVVDEPGALAKVAKRPKDADIDPRSLRIITPQDGAALVALSMARTAEAMKIVRDLIVKE